MANAFATNYPITSGTNIFSLLWKLTRVMKKAGWTVTASSDGYIRDTTGVAASDRWGGNADPANDTYPTAYLTDTTAGWIVMSGPQTVKVPLSAAPTGTFRRGEAISQATSGATGELFGYTWDAVGVSGYAVIMPRTGTFDNSHTVTGAISAATFVPTGTVVTYKREIVFAKPANSATSGYTYYICADAAAESAQLFSSIAAATTLPTTTWNGGALTLPQSTITVVSTVGFPSAGTLLLNTSLGGQVISYTAIGSATTFTGGSGGTGTMANTNSVAGLPITAPGAQGTTITAGSNAAALPQGTINVTSTAGFPATGTFTLNIAGSPQTITYTGLTTTTFTGCTGGTGTMLTGQSVSNFPIQGVCVRGSTIGGNTGAWFSNVTANFIVSNNGQAACVNATPSAGVTADGSFYAVASTNVTTVNGTCGFIFTRLDNTEPGDVDPYAFLTGTSVNVSAWTNQLTVAGNTNDLQFTTICNTASATGNFVGYAARGCPVVSRDLQSLWTGIISSVSSSTWISLISTPVPFRLLNHPAAVTPIIREPVLLICSGAGTGAPKQIKGTTRWIQITNMGNTYDTFDNKTWLAVTKLVVPTSPVPTVLFGPYDGTTTPIL